MYFGPMNTKITLKDFFYGRFSRYQCSKFFFNFQSCSDVFKYISSSNWSIYLNEHSNWRQLNSLQLSILNFLDRLSTELDASDFEKLEFLTKNEVENSHIVLERIEIANISPVSIFSRDADTFTKNIIYYWSKSMDKWRSYKFFGRRPKLRFLTTHFFSLHFQNMWLTKVNVTPQNNKCRPF